MHILHIVIIIYDQITKSLRQRMFRRNIVNVMHLNKMVITVDVEKPIDEHGVKATPIVDTTPVDNEWKLAYAKLEFVSFSIFCDVSLFRNDVRELQRKVLTKSEDEFRPQFLYEQESQECPIMVD
jgi:hypothetical protein